MRVYAYKTVMTYDVSCWYSIITIYVVCSRTRICRSIQLTLMRLLASLNLHNIIQEPNTNNGNIIRAVQLAFEFCWLLSSVLSDVRAEFEIVKIFSRLDSTGLLAASHAPITIIPNT